MHGQGTEIYSNGGKYEGEYKEGKKNGQGTETYSDGSKYVGEYKEGKKNGQGTYTHPNGSKYVGEYKDDKKIKEYQLDMGNTFFKEKNYKEALKWYRLIAEQGDELAQIVVGSFYKGGFGVLQDDKEAVKWFRLSAEQGNTEAQEILDNDNIFPTYDKGYKALNNGDYDTAIHNFLYLAKEGDKYSQYAVGVMLSDGKGVPQDYKGAVKWFRLSAEQGHVDSYHNLGSIYFNGFGVIQDYNEAIKWWSLSAERGIIESQYHLAMLHEKYTKDYVLSHMWFNIVISRGNEQTSRESMLGRERIEEKMTRSQIEKAQKLAREWVKK